MQKKITRSDLQDLYSNLIGEGEESVEKALPQIVVTGGAILLSIITIAYLAGRRSGRKKSAQIEIRRS